MSSPFDSNSPSIALALDVPFPANVVSGAGVEVDKTNAIWTVGLDIADLTELTSLVTPSGYYLVMLDTTTNPARYEKVRADHFIAGATGLDARTPIGDTAYAILITDRYIGLTATLSAIRTITLPAASSVPGGRSVTLQDEVGGISPAFYHSIVPTGADTIDGASSWIQKTKRGGVTFRSNGSNAWNVLITGQRSPISDTNYTATQGDSVIAYTSLTAARTVTLPAASAYPTGTRLTIVDESGNCSGALTIGITRAGADTINGATSLTLNQARAFASIESDGVSKWTILDLSTITSAQISDSTATGRALITAASAAAARTTLGSTTTGDALFIAASVGAARGTLKVNGRSTHGDTTLNLAAADLPFVELTTVLTAARTWALPLAATVSAGDTLTFVDGGGITSTNTLTFQAQTGGGDTLSGLGVASNQLVLNRALASAVFVSDGANGWTLIAMSAPMKIDATPVGGTTPAAGAFLALSATGNATFTGGTNSFGNLTITSNLNLFGGVAPIRGYLSGCIMSNDVGTPNTLIDISAGQAAADDNSLVMPAAALVKSIAANWAVGVTGALDTGTVAASTTYHVFIIMRTDTGVVDWLFSLSPTSPTMPTNYTKKRRIGSIRTDGSAHILAFSQNGDEFLWGAGKADINTTVGTASTLFALTVPTGLKVNALLRFVSSTNGAVVSSPDEGTVAWNSPAGQQTTFGTGGAATVNVRTNTSGQVSIVASAAATPIFGATFGWVDTRGKLA